MTNVLGIKAKSDFNDSAKLLANSTMNIINANQLLKILDFLNASRSETAQSTFGISIQTFLSSLIISLLYCIFQISIFSLLRTKIRHIYQPNSYFVRDSEKVIPLNNALFSWLPATILNPLEDYKKSGLDAYFFIRFLKFLLVLFLSLAFINIPVLVPLNYCSGYDSYTPADLRNFTNGTVPNFVSGLDRISMSNIAPKFTNRLGVHLTMLIISVLLFHGLVINELLKFIEIKNSYLATEVAKNTEGYYNTILIDNVPIDLLDRERITSFINTIPSFTIKNIWFVYNYGELKFYFKKHLKLLDKIEKLETLLICKRYFDRGQKIDISDSTIYRNNKFYTSLRELFYFQVKYWHFVPYITYTSIEEQVAETTRNFIENRRLLQKSKDQFDAKNRSNLKDHKYNKVFVQFESALHSNILNQIQISHKLNQLDKTLIYVDPNDVKWDNLKIQSNVLIFLKVIYGNFLASTITLGWVVPVAFIGLVTQMPYLAASYPALSWMCLFPDYITDVISNVLSVFLLMGLFELVPYIFRWISSIKCKRTGAEMELDVQRWMFSFLFIHLFLILTISSGFTVIFQGLFNDPVSIPNILATNLPKCSNFFISYILIRGLSYFGNNLIQMYQLFKYIFIDTLVHSTPRRKFKGLTNPPTYKWGSIYASFSVLGSIGLIYSILSPLILISCVISFIMILISFKYSVKYQYNQRNRSENYGLLYPTALFSLFSGIYFSEICLMGLFALARNEKGEANCLYHMFLTFLVFILTAVGQHKTQEMFHKLWNKNSALTLHQLIESYRTQRKENKVVDQSSDSRDQFSDAFHEECSRHRHEVVWLPRDNVGISNEEIMFLNSLDITSSNQQSVLDENGSIQIRYSHLHSFDQIKSM
ncbi:hypothetical protein WICMUC_001839 [Wickerhamomyces mucosus]|uniref:Sporulation-specific protein 75 n=1 Tax=Wickerhamomyces mucosus TaxID=1378264 RepID=A0A9P8PTM4_9ASCO|nr:hypothetical protein WICMUC_001839 [Wickerhamomyces mucosus]